jgi:hypothetical protein
MASLPVGTSFAIYLTEPVSVVSSASGVKFDLTTGKVTDSDGTVYNTIQEYVQKVGSSESAIALESAGNKISSESLSAIFVVKELLTGSLIINPEEYECNYSIDGNTSSTFNLTIRWGTLADGQVIRLTNCSIQDKTVNGYVDSWSYSLEDGVKASGSGGTINPITTI